MINSAKIAMKLNSLLPADEAPEYTEGYEGFYHLLSIQGDVEKQSSTTLSETLTKRISKTEKKQ